MGSITWNHQLDTGHPAVDEQHQEIFHVYAHALESARRGEPQAALAAVVSLLDLTSRHFAFEERLMSESSYGQREVHAAAHAAFMRDLVERASFARRDASSPAVRLWLESRFVTWWKLHVRSNDAALVNHLASLAAPPPAQAQEGAAAQGDKVPA